MYKKFKNREILVQIVYIFLSNNFLHRIFIEEIWRYTKQKNCICGLDAVNPLT